MAMQILMPALSPTMEEGKLSKWLVKEGDEVHSGDILAEIETDKATMEFEAVDEGRIGKLLVPEGAEGIKVNQPIATLLGDGEKPGGPVDIHSAMQSIKDAIGPAASAPAKPAPPKPALAPAPVAPPAPRPTSPTPAPVPSAGPQPAAPRRAEQRLFASPLARRIARQRNVDLASLK